MQALALYPVHTMRWYGPALQEHRMDSTLSVRLHVPGCHCWQGSTAAAWECFLVELDAQQYATASASAAVASQCCTKLVLPCSLKDYRLQPLQLEQRVHHHLLSACEALGRALHCSIAPCGLRLHHHVDMRRPAIALCGPIGSLRSWLKHQQYRPVPGTGHWQRLPLTCPGRYESYEVPLLGDIAAQTNPGAHIMRPGLEIRRVIALPLAGLHKCAARYGRAGRASRELLLLDDSAQAHYLGWKHAMRRKLPKDLPVKLHPNVLEAMDALCQVPGLYKGTGLLAIVLQYTDAIVLDIPAGRRAAGEMSEQAAARGLWEATGLYMEDLQHAFQPLGILGHAAGLALSVHSMYVPG